MKGTASTVAAILGAVAILLAVVQGVMAVRYFGTGSTLGGVVDGLDAMVLVMFGVLFIRRRLRHGPETNARRYERPAPGH